MARCLSVFADIVYNNATTMDAYLVAGDRLSLTCRLSGDGVDDDEDSSVVDCSTPLFTRRSRRRPVDQRRVSESAVQLVIEHVSRNDSGRYFCYTGPGTARDDDLVVTDAIDVSVVGQLASSSMSINVNQFF